MKLFNIDKLDGKYSKDNVYHLRLHRAQEDNKHLCLGIYKENDALILFYPFRMSVNELALMKNTLSRYGFKID